jgi:SAM-dependent methyltransferase
MDQPCSLEDLRACLRDISRVTALTGGYRPTLKWLNHVYSVLPVQSRPVHIVDIGCGYGDFLRRIHTWAEEKKLPVLLTGIDLNPDAVQVARAGNAHDFRPPQGIDLVISSLVMHHLETREIVDMLDWMESNARLGWFISDLHRHKFPYHAFRFIARFMPWHRFVKHDGPVSILRSFRHADWKAMLKAAAIPENGYILREYRPARLCVARLK